MGNIVAIDFNRLHTYKELQYSYLKNTLTPQVIVSFLSDLSYLCVCVCTQHAPELKNKFKISVNEVISCCFGMSLCFRQLCHVCAYMLVYLLVMPCKWMFSVLSCRQKRLLLIRSPIFIPPKVNTV